MKIEKVKLLNHGTRGLFVKYEWDKEVSGGMKFRNTAKTDYRMPVTPEIRTMLIGMEVPARDILRLQDDVLVSVVGIVGNEEYFQLMCEVVTYDSLEYPVLSAKLSEGTEYSGFEKLSGMVKELYEKVEKYTQGGEVNARQGLLDLREYGDEKVKKSLEEVDIEGMKEEDIVAKYTEFLEKAGCLVSLPAEFSVEEDNF